MKTLLFTLLALPVAYGGQSLITADGRTGTVTLPQGAPYDALKDTRLEVRLTDIRPCQSAPSATYVSNWFRIAATSGTIFALGCRTAGEWGVYETLGTAGSATTYLTPAEAESKTDLIFRMQKDQTNQRYTVEIWTPDGVQIREFISTSSGVHKNTAAAAPAQSTFIRGGGTVRIAWMRWYSGVVPLNSAMPKDSVSEPGDLGNWEFERSLDDTSGRGLNITYANPSYAVSPVYAPILQANVSNAVAGRVMTLDGSASFRWDGQPLGDVKWQWTSGPAKPVITNPGSMVTPVEQLVQGRHTFALTVGGSTRPVQVDVENRDADGLPVYPTNRPAGSVAVSFRLADVANATDVMVVVKKPDGRNLAGVKCTTFPCTVEVDNRQANHQMQLVYRNSNGRILSRSAWQKMATVQKSSTVMYGRARGNTYSKHGSYLDYNLPESSRKFLGRRYQIHVAGAASMIGKYASFADGALLYVYKDSRAMYPDEMPMMYQIADKRGFRKEDMLLHWNTDNVYGLGLYRWNNMARFDNFTTVGGSYANGVLLFDGATFTDVTTAAWNTTPADVVFTSSRARMYVSYLEPFDQINVDLATPRSGGSVTYEYSGGDGMWAPLSVAADGSNGLQQSGRVSFLPPPGWKRDSYNNSPYPKYWVRITVSGAAAWPVLSRVYGDDWKMYDGRAEGTASSNGLSYTASTTHPSPYTNGVRLTWTPNRSCAATHSPEAFSTLNVNGLGPKKLYMAHTRSSYALKPLISGSESCDSGAEIVLRYDSSLDGGKGGFRLWDMHRGWCTSDTNGNDRYTSEDGTWEYDPTPGGNCSAKFRYQARQLFGWKNNNFAGNMADMQKGRRTRSQYMVDMILPHLTVSGVRQANGIFMDDMDTNQPASGDILYPAQGANPNTYSEIGAMSRNETYDLLGAHASSVRSYLREVVPDGKVALNGQTWALTRNVDTAFYEWGHHVYAGRGWRYSVNPDIYGSATPDVLGRGGWGSEGMDRHSVQQGIGIHGQPVYSLHTYLDTTTDFVSGNTWWLWDRGNRGPVTALAMYYLGASDYTAFNYIQTAVASYFQSDEYFYWEETPDVRLGAAIPRTMDGSTKTLTGDFRQLPSGSQLVHIGEQNITLTKVSNAAATTTNLIVADYPAGTGMYVIRSARMSQKPAPPVERIYRWFTYFPARDIDVGVPDTSPAALQGDENTSGIPRRGFRKMIWYAAGSGASGGGLKNEISRRDYTNAIVLFASGAGSTGPEYSTWSRVLDLNDAEGKPIRVWPLRADGLTWPLQGGRTDYCGPEVTPDAADGSCNGRIQLRNGEGLVLMKRAIL